MPTLLLLALAAATAARADPEPRFSTTLAPHFEVRHQDPWLPAGFTMSLEKMHSRLRLDLAMFSPWMARERVKLYLYGDKRSYLAGRFRPPSWSNGVALYGERAVALYRQPDDKRQMEIIAHETAHLLFESYWGEQGKAAPAWLNEGLAMVEEAEAADRAERSGWYQAMPSLASKGYMPFERFFALAPAQDVKDDRRTIDTWYVQAYALVHFLLRRHSRLQFRNFCSQLRDGRGAQEALWMTYRYRDLGQLEDAWLRWLQDPAHAQAVSASYERKPERRIPRPLGAIDGFEPLRRPGDPPPSE